MVLLALAIALVISPTGAQGQNFSANAHGVVTTIVSITKLSDLAFGATAITPGAVTTVTPANGARVRVDYNEPTSVTTPAFVMLTGPAGAQLRVDFVCAEAAAATSPTPTPFPGPCAGGFVPPLTGSVGGTHHVYIGGAVTAGASNAALAGSYSGGFTVTATFVVY